MVGANLAAAARDWPAPPPPAAAPRRGLAKSRGTQPLRPPPPTRPASLGRWGRPGAVPSSFGWRGLTWVPAGSGLGRQRPGSPPPNSPCARATCSRPPGSSRLVSRRPRPHPAAARDSHPPRRTRNPAPSVPSHPPPPWCGVGAIGLPATTRNLGRGRKSASRTYSRSGASAASAPPRGTSCAPPGALPGRAPRGPLRPPARGLCALRPPPARSPRAPGSASCARCRPKPECPAPAPRALRRPRASFLRARPVIPRGGSAAATPTVCGAQRSAAGTPGAQCGAGGTTFSGPAVGADTGPQGSPLRCGKWGWGWGVGGPGGAHLRTRAHRREPTTNRDPEPLMSTVKQKRTELGFSDSPGHLSLPSVLSACFRSLLPKACHWIL